MKLVTSLALLALLVVAGVLVYLFSGGYNVAAINPERGFMEHSLARISDRSVERHAEGIRVPPLADPAMLQLGAAHYGEMCVGCHGAPGVKPSEIGMGLNPGPPDLVDSAKELPANQVYWIVKNGIRMTGMPAFGPTHDERELWSIVAFVKGFPRMSPEAYQAAVRGSKGAETDRIDSHR